MAPSREDYAVGFGKPPKHTQFKKGRSGNPRGQRQRKRRPKSLRMIMDEIFAEKIRVREGGRSMLVTVRQAIIMRLSAKARKGDRAAINVLLDYIGNASAHQEFETWEVRIAGDKKEDGG
jgi:Family of unknown function (DUF5681)